MPEAPRPHVLCVDDDRDVGELVQAILVDEGYIVSTLYETVGDALPRVVGRLEPDCILLDGAPGPDYGEGWATAEWMRQRRRPVPVVMFSAHVQAVAEARERETERSVAADFAAIVAKPFSLDDLVHAVATAVGVSKPFARTDQAETARTDALVEALRSGGATEIAPSTRREWATFRNPRGHLMQLYWWQAHGVYEVARFTERGHLQMMGQLADRDAAIDLALGRHHN